MSEADRQVALWRSSSCNPEHRFNKQSIIGNGHSAIAGFAGQVILDLCPWGFP
jgi:hypothetical protein